MYADPQLCLSLSLIHNSVSLSDLLERSHDVCAELGVYVRVPDLLVQQLPRRSLQLGRGLLRLEADVQGQDLPALLIRRQLPRHHPDKGGFAGPVLAEQDKDLGVRELARVHLQLEGAHRLLHARVVVPRGGEG